jgi:hypothetical protein
MSLTELSLVFVSRNQSASKIAKLLKAQGFVTGIISDEKPMKPPEVSRSAGTREATATASRAANLNTEGIQHGS